MRPINGIERGNIVAMAGVMITLEKQFQNPRLQVGRIKFHCNTLRLSMQDAAD